MPTKYTELDRLNLEINTNFIVTDNSVMDLFEVMQYVKTPASFALWCYFLRHMDAVNYNHVAVGTTFKETGAADTQTTVKKLLERIAHLVSLDLLKVVAKNGHDRIYMVNPVLTFKGRMADKVLAIMNYYSDGHTSAVLTRFEAAHCTLASIKDKIETLDIFKKATIEDLRSM